MTYRSKRDPEVTAVLDYEEEKYKTVTMIYLTGPEKGKSFSINRSTLKMWWEEISSDEVKIEKPKKPSVLDKIDYEQVNKPYPEPKEQKYIPVPQSVIEYEQNKSRSSKSTLDFSMPKDYEELADLMVSKHIRIKRINTGYISLPDNTKIKLQSNRIAILASQEVGERLVKKGLTCRACIEEGTPFRFDIIDKNGFETMLEVLASE